MSKKKLAILTLILFALLVGAAFYFRLKEARLDINEPDSNQNTATATDPSEKDVSVQTSTDTSGKNIFSSIDSKLQVIYPASWQLTNLPRSNPDILQSITLQSAGILATVDISEQYDRIIDNFINCQINTCEEKIINTKPVIIENSPQDTPKIISLTTIFNRKVYRVTFNIESGTNQAQNTQAVQDVISTIKYF